MTWTSALRDGESLSGDVLQRILWAASPTLQSASGVGTGFTSGGVAAMATDLLVTVSSGLNLSIAAGTAMVTRDTTDPRVVLARNNATSSLALTSNGTGSTRNDTVSLRFDMTTAPDSTGSNLPSIVKVDGASGGAVGNAPADGSLYYPLALAAVSTSNVVTLTDLRRPGLTAGDGWRAPTYTNGWVDFGAPYHAVAVRLQGTRVDMRGVMRSGTINTTAFTLPSGYRPVSTVLTVVNSNAAFGQLTISNAGVVTPSTGSNAFYSFDGVTFDTI